MLSATDIGAELVGAIVILALLAFVWLLAATIERYYSCRDADELAKLNELMQEELANRAVKNPIWDWPKIAHGLEANLITFFDELSRGEIKQSGRFVDPVFLKAQMDDLEACAKKGEAYATGIKRIERIVPLTVEEVDGQAPLLHVCVSCEFNFRVEKKDRDRPIRRMSEKSDFPDAEMYDVLEAMDNSWRILTLLRYEQAVDAILAAEQQSANSAK